VKRSKALIEGGQTERLHATYHHRPYSVAQHSWNMAALLEVFKPDASLRLVKACLFHDVAERWVGDMPAPAKWWLNPLAGEELRQAEARIKQTLQVDYEDGLNREEGTWLKAMDLLELYLFCLDEQGYGNNDVASIVTVCREKLGEAWVPKEVKDFLANLTWTRTSDLFNTEVHP
jgi:5'-deoxynucleotidase YfbR-like HD superfamily hydrolase